MQADSSKPVIGIVGGIGAGKSTVAAEFEKLGCVLIDGDAIGHKLLREPDVRREIRDRWGEGVFGHDGEVNRQKLAAIVFEDDEQLRQLNHILHPRIRASMERRIAEARRDASTPAVVMDAAVLLDAGWDDLCTHLIFVEATPEERAGRAKAKRGWDKETWKRRENLQIPLDKKSQMCDYTADNSSKAFYLGEQVRRFLHKIVHTARSS